MNQPQDPDAGARDTAPVDERPHPLEPLQRPDTARPLPFGTRPWTVCARTGWSVCRGPCWRRLTILALASGGGPLVKLEG